MNARSLILAAALAGTALAAGPHDRAASRPSQSAESREDRPPRFNGDRPDRNRDDSPQQGEPGPGPRGGYFGLRVFREHSPRRWADFQRADPEIKARLSQQMSNYGRILVALEQRDKEVYEIRIRQLALEDTLYGRIVDARAMGTTSPEYRALIAEHISSLIALRVAERTLAVARIEKSVNDDRRLLQRVDNDAWRKETAAKLLEETLAGRMDWFAPEPGNRGRGRQPATNPTTREGPQFPREGMQFREPRDSGSDLISSRRFFLEHSPSRLAAGEALTNENARRLFELYMSQTHRQIRAMPPQQQANARDQLRAQDAIHALADKLPAEPTSEFRKTLATHIAEFVALRVAGHRVRLELDEQSLENERTGLAAAVAPDAQSKLAAEWLADALQYKVDWLKPEAIRPVFLRNIAGPRPGRPGGPPRERPESNPAR